MKIFHGWLNLTEMQHNTGLYNAGGAGSGLIYIVYAAAFIVEVIFVRNARINTLDVTLKF